MCVSAVVEITTANQGHDARGNVSVGKVECMSIAKEWEIYRKKVVPANCSTVQLVETRQAFYAGAAVLFALLVTGISNDEEPTAADMAVVEELAKEIDRFGIELMRNDSSRNVAH